MGRLMARVWVVVVACAAGVACGESEEGSTPDAEVPPPPPEISECQPQHWACREHEDCCSGWCEGSACFCRTQSLECDSPLQCCEGLDCVGGVCVPGCRDLGEPCVDTEDGSCCSGACQNGVCAEIRCGAEGAWCLNSFDCCTGQYCDVVSLFGTCREGCGIEGASCDRDSPCCVGFVCSDEDAGGVCERTCLPEGEGCTGEGTRCCEGNECVDGTCQPCVPRYGGCREDAHCCGDRLHCIDGSCTCQFRNDPCEADTDCCPDFVCDDGQCGSP